MLLIPDGNMMPPETHEMNLLVPVSQIFTNK